MDIENQGISQIGNGCPTQPQGLLKEDLIWQSSFKFLVKALFLLHLCLYHSRNL